VKASPKVRRTPICLPSGSRSSPEKTIQSRADELPDAGGGRRIILKKSVLKRFLRSAGARKRSREHHVAQQGYRVDPQPHGRAGFTEIQTPILSASSLKGARFFVPSRTCTRQMALQAPQMFAVLHCQRANAQRLTTFVTVAMTG
jgi:hypothetical protein